jgi:hypothetical protein
MPRFADIVEDVTSLSTEEMEEIRRIINHILIERRKEHFLETYKQALKESKEGKLFSSDNFEEIAKWLNNNANA